MTDERNAVEFWTDRNAVTAPATQVTFFEDRAEVVRRTSCEVPAGCSWVTILGVGLFVDDPSVVVRAEGDGVRGLSTRVLRMVRSVSKAKPGDIATMELEFEAASRRLASAQRSLNRSQLARARIMTLMEAWCEAMERLPSGSENAMTQWRTSYEALNARIVAALEDASVHSRSVRSATRDEGRAKLRLELGKSEEQDYQAAIEVQLEARKAQRVELEVVYRTPCALWRPEHVARLRSLPDGTHELELRTLATVWQATGEEWNGVICRFSTARPTQSASPPLLSEDILTSRRKTETERRQVVVEERDESLATVGLERGARQVEEMPGVDDGGEPITYEVAKPCTIASDGQPFRVELHAQTAKCEMDRIVYPERSEAVHFRATATLSGKTPLLAGPLWIARGSSMVGRSRTDFVGQGEPFELGMGVDDGLRVRRTFEEKRETTPVIGTQKIDRKVRLFVSNLSEDDRGLHIVERFPISEIEDVQVDVTSHREGHVDQKTGFVHYDVDVPAHGTKELTFEYRIEASGRVAI